MAGQGEGRGEGAEHGWDGSNTRGPLETTSMPDVGSLGDLRVSPTGGTASFLSCVVNLTNTVAGAGMLGLPGAYAGSGYLLGTALLIVASAFSLNGLRLLALSAEAVGISYERPSSFYTVARAALPGFTVAIDAAVALKCFGVATGYFVTVGDCMVDAFHYLFRNFHLEGHPLEETLTDRHFWVLSGLALVVPISFHRTLDALRFTSTLSLVLIYALAVGIVMYAEGVFDPCEGFESHSDSSATDASAGGGGTAATDGLNSLADGAATADGTGPPGWDDGTCQGPTELVAGFESTVKNLAIFVFSFTCHQNVFTVVNEIRDRTRTRLDSVLATAIGSALALYLAVAIEGYRTYGSEVRGDILLNYPQTALVTTMRIFIAVMVILSYPLQLDPSRRCITSMIHAVQRTRIRKKQRRGQQNSRGSSSVSMATIPSEIDVDPVQNYTLGGNYVNGAEEASSMVFPWHSDDSKDKFHAGEALLSSTSRIHPPEGNIDEAESPASHKGTTSDFLFNGITCIFLILSFVIAMVVSDLGIVLGVVGATGSTMVSYILPGLIYIRLYPDHRSLKVLAYVQVIIGCAIVPTALYFVIFRGAAA